MILGTRPLVGHLKWTPKSIEWGPRSEPKKLSHHLKFDDHEVHLTCRGPLMILGTRPLVGNLKWTPKSIEWDNRSEPKNLRHYLKFFSEFLNSHGRFFSLNGLKYYIVQWVMTN